MTSKKQYDEAIDTLAKYVYERSKLVPIEDWEDVTTDWLECISDNIADKLERLYGLGEKK